MQLIRKIAADLTIISLGVGTQGGSASDTIRAAVMVEYSGGLMQ